MTLEEFITKWNGKYVDTDNAYGAQCMDLMHQYCVEVLGLDQSVLAAPSAQQVYTGFLTVKGHELFDQIGNTPTGVPQEGDIVFWTNLPYGHVAIFHDGDANQFKSFDQNYPTGSPCHIQNHTYASVGGWLRFKGQPIQNNQSLIDELRADRDKNWQLYQGALQKQIELEDAVAQKQKTIDELTRQNLEDKTTIEVLTKQKQAALDDYTALKIELETAKRELSDCLASQQAADALLQNRKPLSQYTTKEIFYELIGRFHV